MSLVDGPEFALIFGNEGIRVHSHPLSGQFF